MDADTLIKAACPDDAAALATLEERANRVALAHIFPPELPYPYDDVLARWRLVLGDPDVKTLAAWSDHELVGLAAYDAGSLRHLAVSAARFGTGLADDLHARATDAWCRAATTSARLWVLEANHRARRFYHRHGWVVDGRRQDSPWLPYPAEIGYALTVGGRTRPLGRATESTCSAART